MATRLTDWLLPRGCAAWVWPLRFSLRSLFLAPLLVGVGLIACQFANLQVPYVYTGRSLDLTIDGPGYFQVVQADYYQPVYYTRGGRFWVDNCNQVRFGDPNQRLYLHPVISLPMDGQPRFEADGAVYADVPNSDSQMVGGLQLTRFANPDGLIPFLPEVFRESEDSGIPWLGNPGEQGFGRCMVGWLENCDPHRQDSAFSISPAIVAAFFVGGIVGFLWPRRRPSSTPPLPAPAGDA